jgi:F0F1-type ATP synthase membrane subunit c/vacuolar-type H+-ATPase subunit K
LNVAGTFMVVTLWLFMFRVPLPAIRVLGRRAMLFVKAAKVIALSITFLPLMGCAIATGMVFSSLIRGISYSPDSEEVLFNYTTMGFAFVESFAFMLFMVAAAVVLL